MTDIDSGNGLLPEGTKPLAEPILKLIPGMMYVIRRGVSLFFLNHALLCQWEQHTDKKPWICE